MNPYKLRAIVQFLQTEATELQAPSGAQVGIDELLACFGLHERLTREELLVVKREMLAIAEAEAFVGQLRLGAPL